MRLTWVWAYPGAAIMCLLGWIWYMIQGVECVIDFFWILNQFAVGSFFLFKSLGDTGESLHWTYWVQYFLLFLWLIRLGGFLLVQRVCKNHPDRRYDELKSNYPKSYKLFFLGNYQLQGVLLMFTSSSLYWAFYRRSQNPNTIVWEEWITWSVGMALAIKGLIMEGIADNQLEAWKAGFAKKRAMQPETPNDKGDNKIHQDNADGYKLAEKDKSDSDDVIINENKPLKDDDLVKKFHRSCIQGLWGRSRHPNLWYELEFWLGFSIIGVGDGDSWVRIFPFLGPFFLWCVMYFLTIPLTEKTMKESRKDYWEEYCKRYNMLLPNRWP